MPANAVVCSAVLSRSAEEEKSKTEAWGGGREGESCGEGIRDGSF